MASVDDYTSGRALEFARQALLILKASDDPLTGTPVGEKLLAEISKSAPKLLDMTSASQQIQAARQCAVGPRVCYALNPEAEFTEAVFLDELAEGMVAAGKAKMVSKQEAIDVLAKYKKNLLVMSVVSCKPLELCRTSPETCLCWNMERRGLKCVQTNL